MRKRISGALEARKKKDLSVQMGIGTSSPAPAKKLTALEAARFLVTLCPY
jgi:hypothetical protein